MKRIFERDGCDLMMVRCGGQSSYFSQVSLIDRTLARRGA
jgi:hypothetical protein